MFNYPLIGFFLFIISPIIEGIAIYLEQKNRPKSIVANIGNIFALLWIMTQIIVTGILVLLCLFQ
jgi:hypothetical protein